MSNRIQNEILHGEKICSNAEEIWGWSSPAGKKRADRRAQYFIQYGNIQSNQNILEIGCGTGIFTEKISKQGSKITAIDLSEDLLKRAKSKNIPNCHFEQGDAHQLKYQNESFDVVIGSSILHHLDVQTVLNEIYRVLKNNGKLVFAEPNMLNPQIMIQKNIPFIKKWLGDSPDETAFFRWPMEKVLEKLVLLKRLFSLMIFFIRQLPPK